MSASMRTRLLALSCLLACAMAQSMPWDFADIGTGVPMAANCTPSGSGMPAQWIEMTDLLNFTQYEADALSSDVPDPLPFPYSLTAADTRAPGWLQTCIARSPTAPEDCQGEECNVYIEEWDIEWLEFALLNCFGSYPTPDAVNFFTNPTPPPGNVALTVTQTCKNYYYGPSDEWDFFYSVTDEWGNKWALQWGNKWALQTVHSNDTTEAEFDANIGSVVWPEGWVAEKVPLTETVEMVPFAVGNACYALIIKDSNFNSWHLYTYPEGGVTSGDTLFGAIGKGCQCLDAQYTLEGMGGAPSSAPSPAP
ncbi:expressed protein [Chlorella variabilis]|uniref:Expressed protein n=1 Tax=Chlorella variabilis TaxID=554065 RepID=E1ZNW8_CHLVA|nr:expressed protein [Chlorella variabilis]EFN52512.1 expressed protein [Chlorella variabilis]|eukprot:XP_005844614.1 expressed protein [Chlorella variabilis]